MSKPSADGAACRRSAPSLLAKADRVGVLGPRSLPGIGADRQHARKRTKVVDYLTKEAAREWTGSASHAVGRWQSPMRLNDRTRAYFEKLATTSEPDRAAAYKKLLDPATGDEGQTFLHQHSPPEYSIADPR